MLKNKVIIIGAGLAGLTAAFLLKQKGIEAIVLEARSRIGGRIFTQRTTDNIPVEMGATWLGKKHRHLMQLLKEMNIGIFEQFQGEHAIYEAISTSPPQLVTLPYNPDPSYRIQGGSAALIDKLAAGLASDQIQLNQPVQQITFSQDSFSLTTKKANFQADLIISTMPPNLLIHKIDFEPALPEAFVNIAKQTHTWMGESIKVALTFEKPFWKEKNTSGTIFSNVGPVSEMYDHTDFEQNYFALKGFLNGAFHIASPEERQAVVLKQLKKYYGEKVEEYLSYEEYIWRADEWTFVDYSQPILPHYNNGHEVFRSQFFDGQLIISGAETAAEFPGYMDGAVSSGWRAGEEVLKKLELV